MKVYRSDLKYQMFPHLFEEYLDHGWARDVVITFLNNTYRDRYAPLGEYHETIIPISDFTEGSENDTLGQNYVYHKKVEATFYDNGYDTGPFDWSYESADVRGEMVPTYGTIDGSVVYTLTIVSKSDPSNRWVEATCVCTPERIPTEPNDWFWAHRTSFIHGVSDGDAFAFAASDKYFAKAVKSRSLHPDAYYEQIGKKYLAGMFSLNSENTDFSSLYVDCLKQFTPLTTNSIANAMEFASAVKTIASTVYGLAKGKLPKKKHKSIHKHLQDDWLTYRYAYSTTKMDLCDYADKTAQAIDTFFDVYPKLTHSRKKSIGTYNGKPCECALVYTMAATPRIPNDFSRDWLKLSSFGLAPNLTNIWDLVPFSFMVDWFSSIGDFCSWADAKGLESSLQLDFLYGIESSKFSYTPEAGVRVTQYTRRIANRVPTLVMDTSYEPSTKTWIKRAADAFSIFIS